MILALKRTNCGIPTRRNTLEKQTLPEKNPVIACAEKLRKHAKTTNIIKHHPFGRSPTLWPLGPADRLGSSTGICRLVRAKRRKCLKADQLRNSADSEVYEAIEQKP